MLYFDPAYFSFELINNQDFSIALGRWGAILSQFIPLWALKHDFQIETILQLYSISFIIVYYFIFLIIYYGFRDFPATLVLIFALCLTFRSAFYYPTAELYHGIALSVLFWALLKKLMEWKGIKLYAGFAITMFLIVSLSYFHQLTIFLLLFFITIEWLVNEKPANRILLVIGAFSIAWYFVRIKFLTFSEYENNKVLSVYEFVNQVPGFKENPTLEIYISFFRDQALLPLIAFAASLILLLKTNIKLVVATLLIFIGFSFIIIVTLYRGESIIMSENYFTVLGAFMAIPIVKVIYDYNRYIFIALILILCSQSLISIYKSATPILARTKLLENMVDYGRQFSQKKFIIEEANYLDNAFLSSWSMPFETLLLSSLTDLDESVTFFIKSDTVNLVKNELNNPYVFLGPTWSPYIYKTNTLNLTRFHLPKGPYLHLSTNQDLIATYDTVFDKKNILIDPVRLIYKNYKEVAIKITNLSDHILPSIPGSDEQIYLSYHLIDKMGNMVSWDNRRTLIALDIHPGKTFIQKINIDNADLIGQYTLVIDLVTEGKRWWGIDSKTEIIFN